MTCDCDDNLVPGVLFPMYPDGDDSFPFVERCDMCKRFDSDLDAARALAVELGRRFIDVRVGVIYDDPQSPYFHPFIVSEQTRVETPEVST